MGRKRIDLVGKLFGRLTVVAYSHTSSGKTYWNCLCECGEHRVVQASHMKSKTTISCGCYQRERTTTHGMRGSSEYHVWKGMIQRCNNPNSLGYKDYGGRGITVCPEWSSFESFYEDMGNRPSKEYTLDRKDNTGNYCKENCRWATKKQQANNNRANRLITHNGQTKTMAEWSLFSGIPYETLRARLSYGWDLYRALTAPVQKHTKRGDT